MIFKPNRFLKRWTTTLLLLTAAITAITATASAQGSDNRPRNNPYSPSPNRKPAAQVPVSAASTRPPQEITVSIVPVRQEQTDPRPAIAQRTTPTIRTPAERPAQPNEIYKIGVGDVLYINLQNTPQGAGYYTVRGDGTIDFPLAGDNVVVAGETIEKVSQGLVSGITLYPDPQVDVKIREYSSHKIKVSGLVENPGERSLQREAVPLYVIKADAIVDRNATRVLVDHGTGAQAIKLSDPQSDSLLIYPGDTIEFTNDFGSGDRNAAFYFIGGDVVSAGQKALLPGITLYQALIASGGSKGDPKKAVIRRKNDKGLLAVSEHNIHAIRDGKTADPILAAGDIIEIHN